MHRRHSRSHSRRCTGNNTFVAVMVHFSKLLVARSTCIWQRPRTLLFRVLIDVCKVSPTLFGHIIWISWWFTRQGTLAIQNGAFSFLGICTFISVSVLCPICLWLQILLTNRLIVRLAHSHSTTWSIWKLVHWFDRLSILGCYALHHSWVILILVSTSRNVHFDISKLFNLFVFPLSSGGLFLVDYWYRIWFLAFCA